MGIREILVTSSEMKRISEICAKPFAEYCKGDPTNSVLLEDAVAEVMGLDAADLRKRPFKLKVASDV